MFGDHAFDPYGQGLAGYASVLDDRGFEGGWKEERESLFGLMQRHRVYPAVEVLATTYVGQSAMNYK
jgi:hypothetical protein